MKPTEKKQYLFLAVLTTAMLCLSFISILTFGKQCTLEFQVNSPENIAIQYDRNIVECISQQASGNMLTLDFRAVSRGDTFIMITKPDDDIIHAARLYVHVAGVITEGTYFGKCRGDILFSVSFSVILLAVLLILCKKYRASTRENLCRYVNTRLLGAIIFIGFVLTEQLLTLILLNRNGENPSVIDIFQQTSYSARYFSMILLPLALVISLAISGSNLILMRREGFGLRNMLGFFLGIVLCAGTIAPDLIYILLQRMGVNIYNYASRVVLAERCAEDIVAVVMAYFECILIGTAISAVRAARHIPAFDRDFILILGCQITKDGGLTKLLQSRADRAVEFARMQKEKTGKELVFVPSGGKGDDEVIAEAEAIQNYLLSAGIPQNRILTEDRSKNTEQNIRFSYGLIKEQMPDAKIAFSTTNYHVFRAGCFAEEAGILMEGIGAKTKTYFWVNAFIREFIAALHYEKIKHIRNLLLIICFLLPLESVNYYTFLY